MGQILLCTELVHQNFILLDYSFIKVLVMNKDVVKKRPTKSAKLKRGSKTKGRKKKRGKSKIREPVKKKVEVDILSPAAMLNAQYICHDAADCLEKRGFKWPDKGGKKKGRKKKEET